MFFLVLTIKWGLKLGLDIVNMRMRYHYQEKYNTKGTLLESSKGIKIRSIVIIIYLDDHIL